MRAPLLAAGALVLLATPAPAQASSFTERLRPAGAAGALGNELLSDERR